MWTNTQSTFLSTIHIRYFIMMMMTTETHKIFLFQIKIFQINYTKPYFVSIIVSNLSFSVWIVTMYYFTVIENCHININYELIKFVEIFSIFFPICLASTWCLNRSLKIDYFCILKLKYSVTMNWLGWEMLHVERNVIKLNEMKEKSSMQI